MATSQSLAIVATTSAETPTPRAAARRHYTRRRRVPKFALEMIRAYALGLALFASCISSAEADGTCTPRATQNACGTCRIEADCGGGRSTAFCQRGVPQGCGGGGSTSAPSASSPTTTEMVVASEGDAATVRIGAIVVSCQVYSNFVAGCTLQGTGRGPATISWWADELICDRNAPEWNGAHWYYESSVSVPASGGRALLGSGVEVWFSQDVSVVEVSAPTGRVRLEAHINAGTFSARRVNTTDPRAQSAPWIADLSADRRAVSSHGHRSYPCVPPTVPPRASIDPSDQDPHSVRRATGFPALSDERIAAGGRASVHRLDAGDDLGNEFSRAWSVDTNVASRFRPLARRI